MSYIHPPKAPFQCVRLDQFILRNRISEDRILSESFHYPVHDGVSIQPLKLRDVEAFFDDKKFVSPSGIDQHKILRRALKSSMEACLYFVDNKRRCMFLTFPQLPTSMASYYCRYHSAALIRHVTKLSEVPTNNLANSLSEKEFQITEETRTTLQQLKSMYYSEPEKTWIMDLVHNNASGIFTYSAPVSNQTNRWKVIIFQECRLWHVNEGHDMPTFPICFG